MVYVNAYGSETYGYNGYKSDTSFNPVLYNFSDDTKYEVVYVLHNPGGGEIIGVGVYDNDNKYHELNPRNISLDTQFTNSNLEK